MSHGIIHDPSGLHIESSFMLLAHCLTNSVRIDSFGSTSALYFLNYDNFSHFFDVQENTNKCWHCSKKVGMVKVPCKCSFVFCPKHRHAEAHECTYDYFAENQQRIAKNNPTIAHEKMEKMF